MTREEGDPKNETKQEVSKLWKAGRLHHTVDWVFSQLRRSRSYFSEWGASSRSSIEEDAWKMYHRRPMQDELEEEIERLERIKKMQSVFDRARNKRKSYETWSEYGPGAYHQHFQREDWYWKTDKTHRDTRTNSNFKRVHEAGKFVLSHHYSILGLDRFRSQPYTDAEVKRKSKRISPRSKPE